MASARCPTTRQARVFEREISRPLGRRRVINRHSCLPQGQARRPNTKNSGSAGLNGLRTRHRGLCGRQISPSREEISTRDGFPRTKAAQSTRRRMKSEATTHLAASRQQPLPGCQATHTDDGRRPGHEASERKPDRRLSARSSRQLVRGPVDRHPVASARAGWQSPFAASAERPLSDDAIGCSRPISDVRILKFLTEKRSSGPAFDGHVSTGCCREQQRPQGSDKACGNEPSKQPLEDLRLTCPLLRIGKEITLERSRAFPENKEAPRDRQTDHEHQQPQNVLRGGRHGFVMIQPSLQRCETKARPGTDDGCCLFGRFQVNPFSTVLRHGLAARLPT